jgi:predicted NUDIX family NTP pyrophosphohydrolase
MATASAGLLLYRLSNGAPEVLLVHPGGPFWAKKDDGAWSIPKGLTDEGEDLLAAARREFEEETGYRPEGEFIPLGNFRQPSGKTISAWAVEGDFDLKYFKSNTFAMEWPPKSGRMQAFPEADRAAWFTLDEARQTILKGQRPMLDVLRDRLARR